MATFELEHGEQIIHREPITTPDGRRVLMPGELILTDRRVVVVAEKASGLRQLMMMFGGVGGLFSGLAARTAMTHEIRREDYADAELTGKRQLRVRSKGEGYTMTYFDVVTPGAASWPGRLHAWAVATASGAAPPT